MSKSKSKLITTINNKYHNAPKYQFPKEFIAMSNAGFENKSYTSYLDVAVHLALATFNSLSGDETKPLISQPISLNMVIDRLNVSVSKKNLNRVRTDIAQSVSRLQEAKIIHIEYLTSKSNDDPTALFKVYQAMVKNKNGETMRKFSIVTLGVFEKLLLINKDDERFKSMAIYMSIAFRIYPFAELKSTTKNESTQAMINAYEKPICFQKLETMGELVGVKSHATVAKYINKFCEMELLAYYKTATIGYQKNQWKYVISKYEDRAILKSYLLYKLDYQNDKYPIIDIFDDSIVANNKEAEDVEDKRIDEDWLEEILIEA